VQQRSEIRSLSQKALAMGADFVATGHYARVLSPAKGSAKGRGGLNLAKGIDPAKINHIFFGH